MTEAILIILVGLIVGTIALEVWFANRRLNEQMAALQFFLDDLDKEGDDDASAPHGR